MIALQTFLRRHEATLAPDQVARLREREADRLGITPPEWAALRAMNVDLAMVREAHRFVSSRASVRRADREGAWSLVAARAGQLRSQPQSFRVGAHVEPAWDHATLKHRLAELVNSCRDAARTVPLAACASLVRGFARAQPFLGENEPTALLVASVLLRAAGLPSLHATDLARDRAFLAALAAPDDDTAMREVLDHALWSEALDHIEALTLPGTPRTLADEHAALTTARITIADDALVAWTDTIRDALAPQLGSDRRIVHATFDTRARAAIAARYHGRIISAHQPILETRWSLGDELDVVLVVAHAGRGLVGAASAHLALELPSLPTPRRAPAPALLLVPDESARDLAARISVWCTRALDLARRASPLRTA